MRDAFVLRGSEREGVVEQIDGVIELDGHLYFVEMKWWENSIGVPEISQHLVRVYSRGVASHHHFCFSIYGSRREHLQRGAFPESCHALHAAGDRHVVGATIKPSDFSAS